MSLIPRLLSVFFFNYYFNHTEMMPLPPLLAPKIPSPINPRRTTIYKALKSFAIIYLGGIHFNWDSLRVHDTAGSLIGFLRFPAASQQLRRSILRREGRTGRVLIPAQCSHPLGRAPVSVTWGWGAVRPMRLMVRE